MQNAYSQGTNKFRVIGEFYKVHYPAMTEVLEEMASLQKETKNPNYIAPLQAVDRGLYLLKISQILFQHKQHEAFIIPTIQSHLHYCCQKLYALCNKEIRATLAPLLEALQRHDVGVETLAMSTLDTVIHIQYPHHTIPGLAETECGYLKWCLARFIVLPDHTIRTVMDSLQTENYSKVPSLQAMAAAVKHLFLAGDNALPGLYDPDFNIYYNQAVFWVSALRLYQEVVFQKLLDIQIQSVVELMKAEFNKFFSWYDVQNPGFLSEHIVKYMEHLVKKLSPETSDLALSEISTYGYHCKAVFQKL